MMKLLDVFLNSLNNLLHIELIAIVTDCIFWLIVFVVGFPLAAVVALVRMVYLTLEYLLLGISTIDPYSRPKEELAVFITGCDSGFGKDLTDTLTARGFVVFCGCLFKDSFVNFQGNKLAIPIQVDVTSDKSVAEAVKNVSTWINGSKNSKGKKRSLHALVNNAGIAKLGLCDWISMSDVKVSMEVNFLGTVRCVKAFLPTIKRQAASGAYKDARIVNMISVAGTWPALDHLAVAYGASKHAADAFTNNLSLEMQQFNVQVTAVNPTFHSTPMASVDNLKNDMRKLWKGIPETIREEYGEAFFAKQLKLADIIGFFTWNHNNVIDAMEESVINKTAPRRILVGLDAKYLFAPANLLPTGWWFRTIGIPPDVMRQTY